MADESKNNQELQEDLPLPHTLLRKEKKEKRQVYFLPTAFAAKEESSEVRREQSDLEDILYKIEDEVEYPASPTTRETMSRRPHEEGKVYPPARSQLASCVHTQQKMEKIIQDSARMTGSLLRKLREESGVTREELSKRTRIPMHYLENLENEHYSALPAGVYLRGFVVLFLKYLGVTRKDVVDGVMHTYHNGRK